ncbi:sigma-54 interaction domain-containing protein [Aneurinibacillus tyrosinisolvens]|uniref:sigma-54 interaction domain-containing protein n=1 Tax=Aneurinibacillus tyrosinisolvens TaxID=1443435 RepID=UPI00063EFF53|nr:sigma-54-dependent Fis family transcriptional regulator [Aneurinibacillus tyrosinisolvens]
MQPLPEGAELPDAAQEKMSVRLMDYLSEDSEVSELVIVSDADGKPCGYIPASTLANSLNQALKQTISFYQTLIETVDDSITIVDGHGIVMGWNRQAVNMYNISKDAILGQHITSHFKEEALMLLKSMHDASSVSRHYNQPREGIHVLVNTSPVMRDGQIVGCISAEKDISDVVRLHDELSNTTAHLHDLEKEFYSDQQDQPFHKIKGHSNAIYHAVQLAQKVARTDATLLITGESGVGKELFAEAVHKASPRADKPFVALNCGAIPAALFESELFGYKKGAFTGAVSEGKKGKIDVAEGGTLFLDEIGELPLDQQVKLLRVLQEKQFYRVGGHEPVLTNVRFVAATNRNLEQMVQAGEFRQDLFYRLNVVSVHVPPLRERREDIPELIQVFLKEFAAKYNKPVPEFDSQTVLLFLQHQWPGNIRQLRNMIERLIILTDQERIEPSHLPDGFVHQPVFKPSKPAMPYPAASGASEYDQLIEALQTTYGNKSAAAQLLGVSRATLYNRLKKYNLDTK